MTTRRTVALVLIIATIPAIILGVPLAMGVWLSDISGGSRVLASKTLPSGYAFRVVQYWNHVDFYTTELRITAPDGTTSGEQLDGDDAKSWRVPMSIDESRRVATVTLGGGRVRAVYW
jgi:hypothetical protein